MKFTHLLAAVAVFGVAGLASAQTASALPRLADFGAAPLAQKAHYTGRRHSHFRNRLRSGRSRQLETGGFRRRVEGRLPQAHIDYCLRQNMGYRISDNTIFYDRFFRVQCVSPYYRP